MAIVRKPKNLADYKEGEYSAFCYGCDCELAVMPPARLQGKDDKSLEWVGNHYFYCEACQKSEGRPEVEG